MKPLNSLIPGQPIEVLESYDGKSLLDSFQGNTARQRSALAAETSTKSSKDLDIVIDSALSKETNDHTIPGVRLATPVHTARESKMVRKRLKPVQIVDSLIEEQNLYSKRFKGEHAAIDRKRDGERKKLEQRFEKQIDSIMRRAEEKHANLEKKSAIEFCKAMY